MFLIDVYVAFFMLALEPMIDTEVSRYPQRRKEIGFNFRVESEPTGHDFDII